MTSKESLETLFDLLCEREHTNSEHSFWLKLYEAVRNDLEILEILKNNLTIDENYYSQDTGSTEAIKLCVSNCVSVEEDEEYTDECYPNCDYYKIMEWLENEK